MSTLSSKWNERGNDMKTHRLLLALLLFWAIMACSDGRAENTDARRVRSEPLQLNIEGRMPALEGAVTWLNSPPLITADLRGKVVVVEFWTYTCVNWRRTLPYVRAWANKYRNQGLVVIGVHTPEFDFERDPDNVHRATKDMEIDYPVAIDSRQRIWNAFGNEYWPALYFVDAQGRIRHHQFGEGDYDLSERVIQQLLKEGGTADLTQGSVSVDPSGLEVAADWPDQRSSETYTGYGHAQRFDSPGGAARGVRSVYTAPSRLRLNRWGLSGYWTVEEEPAVLNIAEGRIVYRFHARDLNLVMGGGAPGSIVRFRVTIDGQPPGVAHGTDINETGYGTVSEPRTYQLIRQPQPIVDRDFEIEFLDPGVEVFDFTFG
jgi:thiol-disulfide isomerase/thioredoxin